MKFLCIVILSATKSLKEFAEKSIGFEWKVDFLVLGDKIQCNVLVRLEICWISEQNVNWMPTGFELDLIFS